ncbi:unnamed protein product [Didymodactylos carnosus]|uniref:Retrotransposon gag domain-containing protein n=1 Tax=Didymodactylos carnosus TaxID=1234261 RepID=A0A814Z255_9BILA|nr:unnamed protein product [Didymodactylos carnosus]CAF4000115.1 unnamed protein product [Didymodactylos carnosus]
MMVDAIVKDLFADKLEKANTFSGRIEQDVDLWLRDITASFDMEKLDPSQTQQVVPRFLTNNALEWYLNNRVIITTWADFVQHLRAAYQSPAAKQIASQKLHNRKQGLHEPVTAYYTDIIRLCKTVDEQMTDTQRGNSRFLDFIGLLKSRSL